MSGDDVDLETHHGVIDMGGGVKVDGGGGGRGGWLVIIFFRVVRDLIRSGCMT